MNLIGRNNEVQELLELYNRKGSDLVAIYGRRRVGKTFLVNQVFNNSYDFRHAGISPLEANGDKSLLSQQLEQFYNSLKIYGMKENKIPKTWLEAFYMLEKLLMEKDNGQKQLVFIDELPWLDTPKSMFLSAFEGFWNSWANGRNIMVIICGSANSWIVNKVINNHGGLYDRVTKQIKLVPFTLKECEMFFKDRDIRLSRYDITQAYMAVGGVPYYLMCFERMLSIYENIDKMFFKKNATLSFEFDRLFSSAFSSPETVKRIVEVLATKRIGYSRDEINDILKTKNGELISNCLDALLVSDFVIKYRPLNDKKKLYYKLIDPFCLFYLQFVKDSTSLDINLFTNKATSQKVISYRGLAFENVCFNHIDEIKDALRIGGVASTQSTFITRESEETPGAQIDLIIERNDNIVNLCEMKFYSDEFANNKEGHLSLVRKEDALSGFLKKKQIIRNTLITTYGLKYNEYSSDYISVITMDDLFK